MHLQKLMNLIGFSALFLWIVLLIYEAVLEKSIVKIFLVFFLLSMVANWTPAFKFYPKQIKMPKEMVEAHMPYLLLIFVWGLTIQVTNLLISPSVPITMALLVIGLFLFIYVWFKTKEKRKKVLLEMKNNKQKIN